MSVNDETLPALGSSSEVDKQERIYRTALAPKDYINLELEAMNRGLKPFGLTKIIMTMYLRKQLVPLKELTPELQNQVVQQLKEKQDKAKQAARQ
ncbi:MAG: hypothetical protein WAW41_04095 [Methylobacter sp.]